MKLLEFPLIGSHASSCLSHHPNPNTYPRQPAKEGGCFMWMAWKGRKGMFVCLVVYFLVGLGFELRALHLQSRCSTVSHTSSPFCSGYFGDGGLVNSLPLMATQTPFSSISASQVIRITGVSHQHWLPKDTIDGRSKAQSSAWGWAAVE
jgi:hypothetical protein